MGAGGDLRLCLVLVALGLAAGAGWAQTPVSSSPATTDGGTTTTAAGGTTAPSASKKAAAHRSTRSRATGTHVIPMETAPASPAATPATAAQQAQQHSADQRLLEQQQAQSDKAAQITNQQVKTAQKQQDAIQGETRIQDAPGPTQTGVVPASGPPVAPANTETRIQDAPGPSQTLPALQTPTPSPSIQAPSNPAQTTPHS